MSAESETVSVIDIMPFWRYAVGPSSGRSPAIPFYTLTSATAFFEEAVRELPFSGCRMYRRRLFKGVETVREYLPVRATTGKDAG